MGNDLGLVGLGVMGQNLVLNMASHGFKVSVYNRTAAVTAAFMEGGAKGNASIKGCYGLKELADSLAKPRKVMLMVKAGAAVDAMIAGLLEVLEPGDVIIDGGNSYFKDSERRFKQLQAEGYHFLGTGVSGGEEGALKGPSIMPGGSKRAWELAGPILTEISAKAPDGSPCCAFLGTGGAGHFVKMVHNGIEYVDMQLIAEAYHIMRDMLGMEPKAIGDCFDMWNRGGLESYLVEITSAILRKKDEKTGKPIVDVIKDTAAQKGTGLWTAQEALALGTATPSLAEAVFARNLSAKREDRIKASGILEGPPAVKPTGEMAAMLTGALGKALLAAKISAYSQGFALMAAASEEYGWKLDLGSVALLWRGGCIIRARFLDDIKKAFADGPIANLMLDPLFSMKMNEGQRALRQVVSIASMAGIPIPALSSSLSYYDGFRCASLPANLTQAQRDFFGAHTYERLDEAGSFHTDWSR